MWAVRTYEMCILTETAANKLADKQLDLRVLAVGSSINSKLELAGIQEVAAAVKFAKAQKKDSLYELTALLMVNKI